MVFFQNLFFLHSKKKTFMENKACIWKNVFLHFFSDLPWKRYSGIETGHVQFSNIVSHEKPWTFRVPKKMNPKKKTAVLKEKNNWVGRIISILDTFGNTKGWKYSINSFCGQKNNLYIFYSKVFWRFNKCQKN